MPVIVADLSSHGFGHLGQLSPVLNHLVRERPDIRLVIRGRFPEALVRRFVEVPFRMAEVPPEATLVMNGPTEVDIAASAAGFRDLHTGFAGLVEREAARLDELSPALLIADVPYVSLAAAHRAGVPAVALCSLNWLDVYRAYCPVDPAVVAAMKEAYAGARVFLQPRPHMAMADLPNRRPIGPIARRGRSRRREIDARLDLDPAIRVVVVSFGGIPDPRHGPALPRLPGVRWIVLEHGGAPRPDVTPARALDFPFIDLLASADAMFTKVGYGTFAEAACNGVRLLSWPRPDWPETPCLAAWADEVATFAMLDPERPNAIGEAIEALLTRPAKPAVPASGIAEAVATVTAFL